MPPTVDACWLVLPRVHRILRATPFSSGCAYPRLFGSHALAPHPIPGSQLTADSFALNSSATTPWFAHFTNTPRVTHAVRATACLRIPALPTTPTLFWFFIHLPGRPYLCPYPGFWLLFHVCPLARFARGSRTPQFCCAHGGFTGCHLRLTGLAGSHGTRLVATTYAAAFVA